MCMTAMNDVQRGELETRAREELKKVLGPQDARKALR